MSTALHYLKRASVTVGCLLVSAGLASGTTGDWFATVWSTEHGMPDNSVRGVAQTGDGFLWVATDNGLARFDGDRFQKFPLLNIAVENSSVARLFVDDRQQLWLAMNRGAVVCIGSNSSRVFDQTHSLPEAYPRHFLQDAEGGVWLTHVNENTAIRIKDGAVTRFTAAEGLSASGGIVLAGDLQGRLWFAKGRSLGVFRDGKFQTLSTFPPSVIAMTPASEGGLWIAGPEHLYRFHEGQAPEVIARLPDEPNPVTLLEDHNGVLWVGTGAQGLFRLEDRTLKPVRTSHRDIASLTEDREGNLWVGTRGGGLNRLRPRVMELLGADSGLPVESLRSICKDRNGHFWAVARNSFLFRLEGTNWIQENIQPAWPGGHAFCVAPDPSGAVWIGMWGQGLYRYHNGAYTTWNSRKGLANVHVRSLMVDSRGNLWVASDDPGGYGAIQRFHNNRWHNYPLPASARILRGLTEDSAGNIWLGTGDGKLFRITDERIVEERMDLPRVRTGIRCVTATSDGSVWIGFAGTGVGRIKDGKFTRITSAEGLSDDYISQIIDDGQGWLWFGGTSVIFKVARREMIDAVEGRLGHVRAIIYGRGEGVPALQAAYEASPGGFRDGDGHLYLATRMGMAIIHTERIRDNEDPPSVVVERLLVNGKPFAAYDSLAALPEARMEGVTNLCLPSPRLRLHPDHRKLEVQFTALSFTAPENVHFRYRLEGSDDDWVEAGTKRSTTYPQLPAGDYTFHVVACNNSGLWNETGASLSFVVLPFFWQTWWFRFSAVTVFAVLVAAVVRYVSFRQMQQRLRAVTQQAAVDKERARIAHDLHDDLGASLTHMTLLLELAARHQNESGGNGGGNGRSNGNGHLQEGLTVARQTIKALDETVWAVNPRNNTLAELIGYIGQFAMEFLQSANIRCQLDLPDDPPDWPVSFDLRHNLFLMVKESLNNVVRHAQATEVRLQIKVTTESLTFLIADNGRGFGQLPHDALADGVRNMRQRAEEIRGQFQIESTPGAGTRVSVVCPWPSRQNGHKTTPS